MIDIIHNCKMTIFCQYFNTYYTIICMKSKPISDILDQDLKNIVKNMFIHFCERLSRKGKKVKDIQYDILFLTCLIVTVKLEKEVSFAIDTFKYFTTTTFKCQNVTEKILELELIILSVINFDVDKFRNTVKYQTP